MNCHDNKSNGKPSGLKHLLHMILCCAIPIVIIFVLPFISGISPRAAGILSIITPFICPVMMGGMVLMMLRENSGSRSGKKDRAEAVGPGDEEKELN